MSKEIMPWDIPDVPSDSSAWERLKDRVWHPHPARQVYINDAEFLFCFKRKDKTIEVCSFFFGHFGRLAKEKYFDDYAVDFLQMAMDKWSSVNVSIIIGFSLGSLPPNRVQRLPTSIKYYNNDSLLSRIELADALKLSYTNHRELRPDFKVTSISERKGGYIDEYSIMRGLSNGDGDLFGL